MTCKPNPKLRPEYESWKAMRSRCHNPARKSYKDYGGRGITICARWSVFAHFLEDMGPRPPGTTLERKNSNGNYETGNCRWATRAEQNANSRKNRMLTFNGETLHLAAWCRRTGLSAETVHDRLADGWSVERTLSTPPQPSIPRSGKRARRRPYTRRVRCTICTQLKERGALCCVDKPP